MNGLWSGRSLRYLPEERLNAHCNASAVRPVRLADFEGIDLPVPRWVGVYPYEHVPFQWSCHIEREPGVFAHAEFLDLSGEDPSLRCMDAMRLAIDQYDGGP